VSKDGRYIYYRRVLNDIVKIESALDLFKLDDLTYYQFYLLESIGLLDYEYKDIDILSNLAGIDIEELREQSCLSRKRSHIVNDGLKFNKRNLKKGKVFSDVSSLKQFVVSNDK